MYEYWEKLISSEFAAMHVLAAHALRWHGLPPERLSLVRSGQARDNIIDVCFVIALPDRL